MKRSKIITAALFGTALTIATSAGAVSDRTTPAIEAAFKRATVAVNDGSYILAQQQLMQLTSQPEHKYSAVAQELLGNVREFKGQIAQAVGEYEAYLERFPNEPGASRVRARLEALYSGRSTMTPGQATILRQRSVEIAAAEAASDAASDAPSDSARSSSTSGSVSVTYRSSQANVEITDLVPVVPVTTEDDYSYERSVSASVNLKHTVDTNSGSIELKFSGGVENDLDDSETTTRVSELSAAFKSNSGVTATVGRMRTQPSAAGYRIDGASVTAEVRDGITIGFAGGYDVGSTSDDLFSGSDDVILSAFTTIESNENRPELTFYVLQQSDGDYTLRQAVGAEVRKNFDGGGVYASVEYDTELAELGRATIGGNTTFADGSRATVRLSFHRSPGLSLSNALIGQTETTLADLAATPYTLDEMKQLSLDRSAEVKTFGATYYRKVSDKWGLNLGVNAQDVSGMPASGGIAAIDAEGPRYYASVGLYGTSIFQENDAVNVGLQASTGDDDTLLVLTGGMRIPVNEKLTLRPSVQIGHRDYTDSTMGTETFIVPRVSAQFKIDTQTNFDLDVGARRTKSESDTTSEDSTEVFVAAGLTRSF